ncbi:hypothetical protein VaNZ11_008110 [Volvox africanus]|uniref:Succinate dehydrogenase assembly factor 2, mitochondrial n=1 Tax=Volvox africanus TaxID=51714 RepID=A0ABQ5S4C2_9CHLO|nr:hypothetical protein VaNZ11_008110 [Volvox africanus]
MLRSAAKRFGAVWLQPVPAVCSLPSTSYSLSSSSSSVDANTSEERRKGMVNKLLYRSKQRGFLELDLLIGLWAETHIPQMGLVQLNEMAQVLDEENPDLFKWLTGQLQPPERMSKNAVFEAIRSHVAQQVQDSAPATTRATAGRDWVRGWDDSWREANKPSPEPQPKLQ